MLKEKYFKKKHFKKQPKIDSGFCNEWVNKYGYKIERYVAQKYFPDGRDMQLNYYATNSMEAYYTVIDFELDDDVKIKQMYDSIRSSNYVNFICIASPGFGKTSTMLTLLNKYKKDTGRKIYQMASEIPLDLFEGVVYDLNDIPNGCDCYIDELGQVWQSRGF